jgi:hypothetical protein
VIQSRQVVKTGFYQRDFGQTNDQQRNFNEQPIRDLLGEVDSFKPVLNYFLPSSNNGMPSLPFSSRTALN